MQKTYAALALILGLTLTLQLVIIPNINKSAAKKTVTYVLESWKKKDTLSTVTYWENQDLFPAVYSIDEYNISWERFYRIKSTLYVEVFARINFNRHEMNHEWIFKLKKTPAGWRVAAFYPSHLKEHEYTPGEKYNPDRNQAVLERIQNRATYKEINPAASGESHSATVPRPKYVSPLDSVQIPPLPELKETKPQYRTIPAAPSSK